ncbi:MAG: HupE/UreJ family protein [Cyanobacteria bacterium P01_C01_bin.89]
MKALDSMKAMTQRSRVTFSSGVAISLATWLMASPAFAHHPLDGKLPSNFFEGFMSGMGHPVIGLDHLAFVIAVGLVAVNRAWGWLVSMVFVVGSMVGTGIHLQALDLPLPEVMISLSVVIVGALVAWGRKVNLLVLGAIAVVAGIFHGYAYGESVVGAEITPLLAYLLGFGLIQAAIALGARAIAQKLSPDQPENLALKLRFMGFAITGFGAAFLASAVLG